MNVPGFTAEASLSRTTIKYQKNAVIGSSGALEVLPMAHYYQGDATIPTQRLGWRGPWERPLTCCERFEGRPYCNTTWVPILDNCYCEFGAAVCRPPVNR